MVSELSKAKHLFALAEEMANIAKKQPNHGATAMKLHMYNSRIGGWDEICVVSEEIATEKKWPVVKVALTDLTTDERAQLDVQIRNYNAGYPNAINEAAELNEELAIC